MTQTGRTGAQHAARSYDLPNSAVASQSGPGPATEGLLCCRAGSPARLALVSSDDVDLHQGKAVVAQIDEGLIGVLRKEFPGCSEIRELEDHANG